MKKQKDTKCKFNIIYFSIIVVFLVIFTFLSGYTGMKVVINDTIGYFEYFDVSKERYEKVDVSDNLFISKYERYENVKKNYLKIIETQKEEGKESYLSKLYDEYGDTAIKGYYYIFVKNPRIYALLILELYFVFIVVIIMIKLIYKYYFYIPTLIVSLICFFASISLVFSDLITSNDFISTIFTAMPIATILSFVNVLINYFVFDKKKNNKKKV